MYWMLITAILPSLVLGWYIWRKDPHPEPVKWVLRAFFLGVGICLPVAFLENFISTLENVAYHWMVCGAEYDEAHNG